MAAEVHLGIGDGRVVVPVEEQAAAYVFHMLSQIRLDGLDTDLKAEDIVGVMFAKGYEALAILVPQLPSRMPEHTFRGFASKEAMERGEIDLDAMRRAPSVPQIREAFQTAIEVSGLEEAFQQAGKVLDWAPIRAAVTGRVISALSNSPSSPPPNGESLSPSSGISSPASDEITLSASVA